jgi:hypothetical protein
MVQPRRLHQKGVTTPVEPRSLSYGCACLNFDFRFYPRNVSRAQEASPVRVVNLFELPPVGVSVAARMVVSSRRGGKALQDSTKEPLMVQPRRPHQKGVTTPVEPRSLSYGCACLNFDCRYHSRNIRLKPKRPHL